MNKQKILTSPHMDTSIVREKLKKLFDALPKDIPDDISSMISGLLDNIILKNGLVTVSTSSTLNVIYILDFDESFYNQVMAAARALKSDITHC
ncbi:hypothetical protein [Arsenophonus nasoniae]|uniref:Uncharacterized protein n=1 Tax=Arsenophonus nasoniae TaxID=638 RepID=A0AA95GHN0_9GAMM|nr:hypothetical protein [Arsenophonus nasoniae]WGL96520.1 hypothetical protein QE207_08265 [Arsenophonus nasoniae]